MHINKSKTNKSDHGSYSSSIVSEGAIQNSYAIGLSLLACLQAAAEGVASFLEKAEERLRISIASEEQAHLLLHHHHHVTLSYCLPNISRDEKQDASPAFTYLPGRP